MVHSMYLAVFGQCENYYIMYVKSGSLHFDLNYQWDGDLMNYDYKNLHVNPSCILDESFL